MQLIAVTDKNTHKRFLEVTDIIYKNDTNYIPHIRQDVEKVFDLKKNKLFRLGGEVIRWIMVDHKNQLIGRVAAFVHPKTSKAGKYKIGGLGFFECINNQDAAFILFNRCKEWLMERGMQGMDGPVNFGERDQFWGLLTENFTAAPSYAMNYNPPYYQAFFDAYGFKNYFNQFVYWRDILVPAQEIFVKKASMLASDSNYAFRSMRGESLETIAVNFLEVYNSAWGGHEGFKNMRKEQATATINSMKVIMDKDILIFAFYKEKPIGFYLNIPELNEFFKYVNGNLNWLGKLKFMYRLKFGKRKTMLGIVFGVSREFQGKGIESALIKCAEEVIVPLNRYNETILTWIGDFNPRMIKVIENLGTELYRTLVTYRILFDDSLVFERHPILGGKNNHSQSTDNETPAT
jgi:GNAT superfamily N-acetyltransferase